MRDTVDVSVNGKTVRVPKGSTIASAVALVGAPACRSSATGEPRGPLCGMGICFECRVTVNEIDHVRGCQVLCEPGMDVRTTAGAA